MKEVTALGKTLSDYLPIPEITGVLTKNLVKKGGRVGLGKAV